MIENYNDYYNKALQLKSTFDTLNLQLDGLDKTKIALTAEIESLYEKQGLYEASINYMKKIVDLLSRSHLDHIEKLLNSAISTIFYDKNYSIEFEISEYRNNNNLNIYLNEVDEEGKTIHTNIQDNGFGVKSIVGFILQVYFILYCNQSRILFADEAFSNLSSQYLPHLRSLITSLAEEYGFIFVLVAHDPRLMELSDKTYEMINGVLSIRS